MTRSNDFAFGYELNSTSQAALLRLLNKLGLVGQELLNSPYLQDDYLPLAHFANTGMFDEWEAIAKVAQELSMETCRLDKQNDKAIFALLDQEPMNNVGLETWKRIRAVPVELKDSLLTVCMANPLDMEAVRDLEFHLSCTIKVVIGSEREILLLLSSKIDGKDGLDFQSLLQSKPLNLRPLGQDISQMESSVVSHDISAPTVIRLVNKIFSGAVYHEASDVHIAPESDQLVVRIRVDGIMRPLLEVPSSLRDAVISRIKVLCGMDIAEKRQPQDGRLRLKTAAGLRDLRISTVPTAYGENVVARILSTELSSLSFESLGMDASTKQLTERAFSRSSKVILVSGPTGSGKTSTLYAALLYLRDGTSNIITIEDPIEYRIPGVTQIQVNPKIGMTFDKGLRSILRQDPDIVMVGEIRDAETAATAMQVAQTGHLVLSTIHTNTAAAAITRLKDLDVPPFLIASSVGGVISQRLLRRLCLKCKRLAEDNSSTRYSDFGLNPANIYQELGCEECSQTGFRGRIGLYSFLEINEAVRQAIRADAGEREIEDLARESGFQTLEEAALQLLAQGLTSLAEIERVLGPIDAQELRDYRAKPTIAVPLRQRSDTVKFQSPLLHEETNIISKRKILLVDDDEDVRSLFQMLLEYEMFEVTQAADGVEALQKIYEEKPELIICDLMMPKMNGLEMVERLRRDPRMHNLPVLMLTAAASEENELKLIKCGANDFVSKSAQTELIVARINRLINH